MSQYILWSAIIWIVLGSVISVWTGGIKLMLKYNKKFLSQPNKAPLYPWHWFIPAIGALLWPFLLRAELKRRKQS